MFCITSSLRLHSLQQMTGPRRRHPSAPASGDATCLVLPRRWSWHAPAAAPFGVTEPFDYESRAAGATHLAAPRRGSWHAPAAASFGVAEPFVYESRAAGATRLAAPRRGSWHAPAAAPFGVPEPFDYESRAAGATHLAALRRGSGYTPAEPLHARETALPLPFDFESRAPGLAKEEQRLKIAIFGFGNFGPFLARTFVRQGHTLLAHSRTDHSAVAAKLGVSFFTDPHALCECHPDVVLLATSILSAESVIRSLPLHLLGRSTLFADVLSVKEFPRHILLTSLPSDFDIICTHPMFGPNSGRGGWNGLPLVFEKVRVGECSSRRARAEAFLSIFEREGCRMVEMSCAEHDAHAAETQFLTHTIGRLLAMLELRSTPINTKGYETLLRLVENTCSDSVDLYNGLFMYNNNSTELLNRLEWAMDSVKKRLFDGLHDAFRKQLFDGSPNAGSSNVRK